MSGYSVSRLSLYAAISAVEQDLRDLISVHLTPQIGTEEIFGDLLNKIQERFSKDKELFGEEDPSPENLILYLDFAESYQLLSSHKKSIPSDIYNSIRRITPKLDKLIPIRNRVMHSRPLGYEDFSIALDVTTGLLQEAQEINWKNLRLTLLKLQQEPSFVLSLEIPVYDISQLNNNHNLPIPDFDETGFIGRQKDVDRLLELCLGTYPVITIHGEGGLGKTALALKVAYEILDREDCPFDAIAWSTSKTQQLTTQEIRRIEGAISDSLNMFQEVSDFLAGSNSQDPLEEVLTYLQEFRILLIVDNLETILDERVRNFLSRLTNTKSKVIITSRISVGAYDYPVKLEPMNSSDSVQLLRTLAKLRGVDGKFKADNKIISEQCNRMHNNPGYIKWFVSAVQVGKRPEEILAHPEMFLDFCMSNVYEYLSINSRKVTSSMQCVAGKHSYAELAFLNNMNEVDLREAINQLLTTNMIIMSSVPRGATFESQYEISELARDYLMRKYPVQASFLKEINKRRRQLTADLETMRALASGDPYSYNSISMRSSADKFIAKYLFDALKQIKYKDFDKADLLIQEAKRLAPDYFEVYRIEALLKFNRNDFTGAGSTYETAVELAPLSAPLRKWYGSFLMRYLDDLEGALYQLSEAARIDPKSADVQIELAKIYMYLRRFPEAGKALDKLRERADLSEKERRIVCDSRIQYFTRNARFSLEKRNYFGALDNIELLRREYQETPSFLIDQKMLDKLPKAIPIVRHLLQVIEEPEAKNKAEEILLWIYKRADISEQDDAGIKYRKLDSPSNLEEGSIMHGKVTAIKSYGVFVDCGNFSGLLHISRISARYVTQDALIQTFKVGDNLKVIFAGRDDKGRNEFSTKEFESISGEILDNPSLILATD